MSGAGTRQAGYLSGSIGKTRHLQPPERFGWDLGPDPGNRVSLLADPAYADILAQLREQLAEEM